MYSFHSTVNKATLDSRYKEIFKHAGLQRKWNSAIAACPDLAKTLPNGKIPEDLLTMKYEDLVDVYLTYQSIYHSLSGARKAALNQASGKVFTYSSYRDRIANFLLDENNGFEIYNCVYCDITDGRKVGNKRQFVTEHILDEGKCPLVGLSLYNFCPSCHICNTIYKGTKPVGNSRRTMKKLGPTSNQYDFEHQVKFVLNGTSEALGRIKVDHPEWYTLGFEYKDVEYKEVVTLFGLEGRYNLPQNILQAIEWRRDAQKNRGIALTLSALIHGISIEEEMERKFNYEAHKKAHSPMLKLMKDMMSV